VKGNEGIRSSMLTDCERGLGDGAGVQVAWFGVSFRVEASVGGLMAANAVAVCGWTNRGESLPRLRVLVANLCYPGLGSRRGQRGDRSEAWM